MASSYDNRAVNALKAIRARLNGEWDEPNLVAIGGLNVDPERDILKICQNTLAAIEGEQNRYYDQNKN